MSGAEPISFDQRQDDIAAFVRLHDERQPEHARQFWLDIHHAKNYLDFTVNATSVADGELTKKLIEDFSAPENMPHRDRTGPERIFIAMRKHAISLVDNPYYTPLIHGGDFEDPYTQQFDEANKVLSDTWRGGNPEGRALNILWQLHRLSIASPLVNTHINPHVPDAIEGIMGWSNGKHLQ